MRGGCGGTQTLIFLPSEWQCCKFREGNREFAGKASFHGGTSGDDVVQILDGSMAAPASEYPSLLYLYGGRAEDRPQIRVDDTGLRMGSITESIAQQPFGCCGIVQRRQ